MIVYGVMAEVSVARLFMAGVMPGVVLLLAFPEMATWLPCTMTGG